VPGRRRAEHLRIISYNLFKGRKWWSGQSVLPEMGAALGAYHPDIVFFQEMRGLTGPVQDSNTAFVHALGLDQAAHGMNFKGKSTSHGNAIYSRKRILHFENFDLSVSRLERRGMLTAECELPSITASPIPQTIRLFCTHLDLTSAGRAVQLSRLADEIEKHLDPPGEPFILAGDFNDWGLEGDVYLKNRLGVEEAYEVLHGTLPKTFPSLYPFVKLDRIYFRGLTVGQARVLRRPFQFLSDHCPLLVDFVL
jgi:endonuclease/exonuclease/phosphatase family metal-dependent hydrolase